MLKITNLTKKFKKKVIFEEINLELEFGNIYGFIGANGSGKSVFFKTICGFESRWRNSRLGWQSDRKGY